MTTPTQTLDDFFSGGSGGNSISWRDKPIGTTVTGKILTVNAPRQQTDPVTKELQFYKDGKPKTSVRIDLQTDLRGWEMTNPPEDPSETDEGLRALYVQNVSMKGAIGDALRKAGVLTGPPQPGATLTVRLIERTPNENRALNPTNKFDAHYVPPTAAATGEFFGGAPQGALAPLGAPVAPPVAQAGPAAYPAASPIQAPLPPIAAEPAAPVAEPEPQRPAAISEEAWAVLPPDTKRQLSSIPF